MDNLAAAVSMAAAGAATLLFRLSGGFRPVRRIAESEWTRYVPPAVLLILAVDSVLGVGGPSGTTAVPGPVTLVATLAVVVLAALRSPLLITIVGGCAVYVLAGHYVPAHW